LQRLRDGRADSIQTSSLHLDLLRDLKRINAHVVAVALPILDDSGLLNESRIRQVN
jgi:phosphate:Na+ symporter